MPLLFFNFLVFLERAGRATLDQGAFPYRRFIVDPLVSIALGSPVIFNAVTWFVVCLLTVEFYHFWSRRIISAKGISAGSWLVFSWLVIYPIGCVVIGESSSFSSWLATHPMGHTTMGKLLLFPRSRNVWYLPEALVAYPFYYLGVFLKEKGVIDHLSGRISRGAALAASLSVCLLTYNLNSSFIRPYPRVLMVTSSHGNPVLFPLTAIAGSLCVIIASSLMPHLRAISFIGRSSLILMGLNGLYTFGIFNRFIARGALALTPDQGMFHTPVSIGLFVVGTVILLAPCVPAIQLLNRYAPQFVGRGAAWDWWAAMARRLAGYGKAIPGFRNLHRGERRRYPRKHVVIPALIQMGDGAHGRHRAAILTYPSEGSTFPFRESPLEVPRRRKGAGVRGPLLNCPLTPRRSRWRASPSVWRRPAEMDMSAPVSCASIPSTISSSGSTSRRNCPCPALGVPKDNARKR